MTYQENILQHYSIKKWGKIPYFYSEGPWETNRSISVIR